MAAILTEKQICSFLNLKRKKLYKIDFHCNSYRYGFEKVSHNRYRIDNFKKFNSLSNTMVQPPTQYTLNGISMATGIKPSTIAIAVETGRLSDYGIKVVSTRNGFRYVLKHEKLILIKKK